MKKGRFSEPDAPVIEGRNPRRGGTEGRNPDFGTVPDLCQRAEKHRIKSASQLSAFKNGSGEIRQKKSIPRYSGRSDDFKSKSSGLFFLEKCAKDVTPVSRGHLQSSVYRMS